MSFGEGGHGKGQLFRHRSISLGDNGEVAIADCGNHCIHIFSLDGKHLHEFGSRGTGELSWPIGVVFIEDRIIVSDNPDDTGRMQEFDLNGAYLRTIYTHEGELNRMCVTGAKNIAVCCEGTEAIPSGEKVFSKQGDLIHQFNSIHHDEKPCSIAYGNGKYFISYFDSNHVRVFDEEDVFLYSFGVQGKRKGQFERVLGLAVYGQDEILVCDFNNHRVQLFTQEGQFRRSFGRHGSGVGQMNVPIDIAVTADGQVLVLECFGNRVQIWH